MLIIFVLLFSWCTMTNFDAKIQIFDIPNLEKPSYIAEGLGFLPPTLTAEYAPKRSSAKATLTEILVADLGDTTSKSPYLIVSVILRLRSIG